MGKPLKDCLVSYLFSQLNDTEAVAFVYILFFMLQMKNEKYISWIICLFFFFCLYQEKGKEILFAIFLFSIMEWEDENRKDPILQHMVLFRFSYFRLAK